MRTLISMKHADANGATDDSMAGGRIYGGGFPARGAGGSMIYALEIKMKYRSKTGKKKMKS